MARRHAHPFRGRRKVSTKSGNKQVSGKHLRRRG